MVGEQCLVGGDDVLLGFERSSHQPVGDFHAADELDHEVHIVAVDDFERVFEHRHAGVECADDRAPPRVHVGCDREPDRRPDRLVDDASVLDEHPGEPFANHTTATKAHSKLAIQRTTSSDRSS